eukprot:SAG31_NODE_6694_length_1922_cov_2.221613_1_plen_140_part_00
MAPLLEILLLGLALASPAAGADTTAAAAAARRRSVLRVELPSPNTTLIALLVEAGELWGYRSPTTVEVVVSSLTEQTAVLRLAERAKGNASTVIADIDQVVSAQAAARSVPGNPDLCPQHISAAVFRVRTGSYHPQPAN